jgi:hypothetical protein
VGGGGVGRRGHADVERKEKNAVAHHVTRVDILLTRD